MWRAPEGSPEDDTLAVLFVLIDDYEKQHWPIGPSNPIDYLKAHMEEFDLLPADLGRVIGSGFHATEMLQRHRPLSLRMMRAIHDAWSIPLDVLARSYDVKPERRQAAEIGAFAKRKIATAKRKTAAPKRTRKSAAKAPAKKRAAKLSVKKEIHSTGNAKPVAARTARRKLA